MQTWSSRIALIFRGTAIPNRSHCIESMTSLAKDFFLFAATAALFTWHKKASAESTCAADVDLKNSAFVFVKPHANTPATQKLVREKLVASGIKILKEIDIDGQVIDDKKLIDQHYYAIASKATILAAKDIPVPKDKFKATFGEDWDTVLKEGRACNALEACKRLNVDAVGLDAIWQTAKVTKFGGGFYCGLLKKGTTEVYVFNAFFMSMRSKFVGPENSIHCFVVEWASDKLSWSDFRGVILGPTDPAEAPKGSLRRTILDQWKQLGLKEEPNKGDNGVHASASPFEGLAEKNNWVGVPFEQDDFGKALLKAGLTKKTVEAWSVDPRVKLEDGSMGSIFDALEDLDVGDCLAKMAELNKINS